MREFMDQNVNINCQFTVIDERYVCSVSGLKVPDDENVNFIIGSEHQIGRTNADVQEIVISFSCTAFIITEFFIMFPNVTHFTSTFSGLTRIQSHAFVCARVLIFTSVNQNPMLHKINSNVFTGATHLNKLVICDNDLSANRIQQLPVNIFRPLTSLAYLYLADNQLSSLDVSLLENNRELTMLEIYNNQINAIGRTFFDNKPSLTHFWAFSNICVDKNWVIGGTVTIYTVREKLLTCFNNFIELPVDETQRFIPELRGPLTLHDENEIENIRF